MPCAAAPRWNRHATDSKQAETRAPSTHPHAVDAVARGRALSKAGTTKRYNRTLNSILGRRQRPAEQTVRPLRTVEPNVPEHTVGC